MSKTDKRCPVADTAALIGSKWVLLILRDLAEGTKRFGELEKSLEISPRTLSARLDELEQAGVVARQCYAEVPPRVEYSLTEKGRALIPIVEAMRAYGKEWL
ncbi:MAG: helix-turn-helix transcriptional regulator [Chloroflexi bacterium]|nr:helix-turn-helix transcriptional regulator [Chloroflexota bacterium]MBI3764352.1 helix-turn-helix transcriptional regulator [Chloroflexota bacterium]